MKNLLFSTTRQWNPGDEFILMGIINLLKEIYPEFNPIIYNRNPEIRQSYQYLNPLRKGKYSQFKFKGKEIIDSFFRIGFWDNSFKDEMELDFVDMVVFAGSPEWNTKRLKQLYKKLKKYDKDIIYLGIGSSEKFQFNHLNNLYKKVLKKAKFISVRDKYTYNQLKSLSPYFLPCPALFSSSFEKEIQKVNKIGLIYGTPKAVINNRIDKQTYNYLMSLYQKLANSYDCSIVCHYIDELPQAKKDFKNLDIYYSYDSQDYLNIYSKFDIVIGPRVHGIGISASIGIPGILISHDQRGETGKGFLAKIINTKSNVKDVLEYIINISNYISEKNKELKKHKYKYMQKYLDLLIEKLNIK